MTGLHKSFCLGALLSVFLSACFSGVDFEFGADATFQDAEIQRDAGPQDSGDVQPLDAMLRDADGHPDAIAADADSGPDAMFQDSGFMEAGIPSSDAGIPSSDAGIPSSDAEVPDMGFLYDAGSDAGIHDDAGPFLEICPENPNADQDLYIVVDSACPGTQASFPPAYHGTWYRRASMGDLEIAAAEVVQSTQTRKHDQFHAVIRTGLAASSTVYGQTATISIVNRPPTDPGLVLEHLVSGTSLTYRSTDFARPSDSPQCRMSLASTDPDGDSVTHAIDVAVHMGGTVLQDLQQQVFGPGDSLSFPAILPTATDLECAITATDDDSIQPGVSTARASVSVCEKTHLTFPATDSKVTLPHDSTLNLGSAGTIEAWVLWDGSVTTGSIYSRWQNNVSHVWLILNSNGLAEGYLSSSASAGVRTYAPPSHALTPESWTHVAMVWDSQSTRLYVGGVLADSDVPIGPVQNPSGTAGKLGQHADGRFSAFPGAIAHFRISSTARYAADFTPSRLYFADSDTQVYVAMRRTGATPTTLPMTLPDGMGGFTNMDLTIGSTWWQTQRCLTP